MFFRKAKKETSRSNILEMGQGNHLLVKQLNLITKHFAIEKSFVTAPLLGALNNVKNLDAHLTLHQGTLSSVSSIAAGLVGGGQRVANFVSGRGELFGCLNSIAGRQLPMVFNLSTHSFDRAYQTRTSNHQAYHQIAPFKGLQLFAKDIQELIDFNLIAYHVSEKLLIPSVVAYDGGIIDTQYAPASLISQEDLGQFIGNCEDVIDCETQAHSMIFGPHRRRIPEYWNVDAALGTGGNERNSILSKSDCGYNEFTLFHLESVLKSGLKQFVSLTGRKYELIESYKTEDADYLIVCQGALRSSAKEIVEYFRQKDISIGAVGLPIWHPFPAKELANFLVGKKGITVLENLPTYLNDSPILSAIRSLLSQCIEGSSGLPLIKNLKNFPSLYQVHYDHQSRILDLIQSVANMLPEGKKKAAQSINAQYIPEVNDYPKLEIYKQQILDNYPHLEQKDFKPETSDDSLASVNPSVTRISFLVDDYQKGEELGFGFLSLCYKQFTLYGKGRMREVHFVKQGMVNSFDMLLSLQSNLSDPLSYPPSLLIVDPNVKSIDPADIASMQKNGNILILGKEAPNKEFMTQLFSHKTLLEEKEISLFQLLIRPQGEMEHFGSFVERQTIWGGFWALTPLLSHLKMNSKELLKIWKAYLLKFAEHNEKSAAWVKASFHQFSYGIESCLPVSFDDIQSLEFKQIEIKDQPFAGKRKDASGPGWNPYQFFSLVESKCSTPALAMGLLPPETGKLYNRFLNISELPVLDNKLCSGCGLCFTLCPDSAIPARVSEITSLLDTAMILAVKKGKKFTEVPKLLRNLESEWLKLIRGALLEQQNVWINPLLLLKEVEEALIEGCSSSLKSVITHELEVFLKPIYGLNLVVTEPFYNKVISEKKGKGGLLVLPIDPYKCKDCGVCVENCPDRALKSVPLTQSLFENSHLQIETVRELDNTPELFLDESSKSLVHGLNLLDKHSYRTLSGGDDVCGGCEQKAIAHLFMSTVESLMQPRVKNFLAKIDNLLEQLQRQIQLKLSIEIVNPEQIQKAIDQLSTSVIKVVDVTQHLDQDEKMVDGEWLSKVNQIYLGLKKLKEAYVSDESKEGRVNLGVVGLRGCVADWSSSYPVNPFPFPWTSSLIANDPSIAIGLFESLMEKMTEGFNWVRLATRELEDGDILKVERALNWKDFTEEEYELCPPILVMGGENGILADDLSFLLRTFDGGRPIKLLCLNTQIASTSWHYQCNQISGRVDSTLAELMNENIFIHQSTLHNPNRLLEAFSEGLSFMGPSLFNIYAGCMPGHGISAASSYLMDEKAELSRFFPRFTYNPTKGESLKECLCIDENSQVDELYTKHQLSYLDEEDQLTTLDVEFTVADFALSQGRFAPYFYDINQDQDPSKLMPLADYLDLDDQEEIEQMIPFIYQVNSKKRLIKKGIKKPLLELSHQCINYWTRLQNLSQTGVVIDESITKKNMQNEMVETLTEKLLKMSKGPFQLEPFEMGDNSLSSEEIELEDADSRTQDKTGVANVKDSFVAPFIDSEQCEPCDACVNLNSNVFAYNDDQKAIIVNPKGSYKDLVKAAEKCKKRLIKPGYPDNAEEKGMKLWIERGKGFNE